MGEFSVLHWVFVLVIVLLVFGPSKLPQLGQSLGKAIRGFKDGLKEIETDSKPVATDEVKKPELASAATMESKASAQKGDEVAVKNKID